MAKKRTRLLLGLLGITALVYVVDPRARIAAFRASAVASSKGSMETKRQALWGRYDETGFERIYQGSALLFAWPLRLQPGQTWETSLRVAIGETAAGAAGTRDTP